MSGQGVNPGAPSSVRKFPLNPLTDRSAGAIDRPGIRRLRAIPSADPDRGWADPDAHLVWPGTIETDGVQVQVVGR